MLLNTLGSRLKNLRIENNLSQKELADILNVHKGSISNWEIDSRFPSEKVMYSICDFFNVSIDYLTGYSDKRNVDIFYEIGKLINEDSKLLSSSDKDNILNELKRLWPKKDL